MTTDLYKQDEAKTMASHYSHTRLSRLSNYLVLMAGLILAIYLLSFDNAIAQSVAEKHPVSALEWSNDGDRLAIGYPDGRIEIVGVFEGLPLLALHSDISGIYTLAWSPDSRYVASGSVSPDSALRIWDAVTGDELYAAADFGVSITVVAWSPSGEQVLGVAAEGLTDRGNAILVNYNTLDTVLDSFGIVYDIQWSQDQSYVAFATATQLVVRDSTTFDVVFSSPIPQEAVRQGLQNQLVVVTWNPDGRLLAGGMGDGRVFVWELNNPVPIATFLGHDYSGDNRLLGWIQALAFNSGGNLLTSVSGEGTVRTWDIRTGMVVSEQHTAPNYAAAISEYGGRVALGLASDQVTSAPPRKADAYVVQSMINHGVEIVVPDPSLERLNGIAEACVPETATR
ncbi:MAG: WD domain, G-beta repeat, partial [Chlorobi bacterium OLB6]